MKPTTLKDEDWNIDLYDLEERRGDIDILEVVGFLNEEDVRIESWSSYYYRLKYLAKRITMFQLSEEIKWVYDVDVEKFYNMNISFRNVETKVNSGDIFVYANITKVRHNRPQKEFCINTVVYDKSNKVLMKRSFINWDYYFDFGNNNKKLILTLDEYNLKKDWAELKDFNRIYIYPTDKVEYIEKD